jgi:hypothetical protein
MYRDTDGNVLATVADIIEHLEQFDPELPVAAIPDWDLSSAVQLPKNNVALHTDADDIADICDNSSFDTSNGYPDGFVAFHAYR